MSTIKDKIKNSYIQSPTRGGTDTAVESFVSNIAVSAYGDNVSVKNNPNIAAHPVYDLLPANFRSFSALSGNAGVENRVFTCSTGTTQFAYGAIQSFRSLNYRAGAGGDLTATLTWYEDI